MKHIETVEDSRYIYVVTECLHNAIELEEVIEMRKNSRKNKETALFDLDEVRSIMFMILQGCEYIHENGIVHRDFKFENILVDQMEGKLKIIDFGMSKNENEIQLKSLKVGT